MLLPGTERDKDTQQEHIQAETAFGKRIRCLIIEDSLLFQFIFNDDRMKIS